MFLVEKSAGSERQKVGKAEKPELELERGVGGPGRGFHSVLSCSGLA